jgi:8-oxo-dGTP pyrophosphatase MutT (NUDIX family)
MVGRVRVDRPGPGEELNEGPVADARPAASAILLRDAADGPEVLLLQRNPAARFMGGAWVFPGGAVHAEDEARGVPGPVGAALRETEEEAGLRLDGPGELVPFSRWITPAQVKIRFDTWFFVARAPDAADVRVDDEEVVDFCWIRPQEALNRGARNELSLVFPTIKHLEELARFTSVDDAMAQAKQRKVLPVEPRVLVDGGVAHIVMPGEPGYEDA